MKTKLSPSVIPFAIAWLAERGHPTPDPAALADIITESFNSYVECYKRYPFFHQHQVQVFAAIAASFDGKPDELHLPVLRDGSNWIIGVLGELNPSDEYHFQRIQEETAPLAAQPPGS